MSKPYKDREKLLKSYNKLGSTYDVADKFGCSAATIQRWMDKFNIEKSHDYADKKKVKCDECGSVIKRKPSAFEGKENTFCDKDCHRSFQSKNNGGENNPNWVEPASMDCEWCDTHFEFPNKYKDSRRFCSLDCANKWKSANLLGEDHHNWSGGTWQYEYGAEWRDVREKVIERDVVCRICGHDGTEHRHEVHHITPLRKFDNHEEANTLDNLILLCSYCHRQVENNLQNLPKNV